MKKVLVVAHDAGGAEIVAAYVAARGGAARFDVYAAGPALAVFRRVGVPAKKVDRAGLKKVIASYEGDRILLGTGHPKSLELAALKLAKARGLKTASYLDSWKRYRERFGYPAPGWKGNLPDELWTGDTAAYALARKLFPSVTIRRTPNQYFKETRSRVRSLPRCADAVLFLSAADRPSTDLLKALLVAFSSVSDTPRLLIRLHPLDDRPAFVRLLRVHPRARAALSLQRDIAADIARAKAAIGGETTSLALAALCGVPTVCLWRKETILPFPAMKRASSAGAAVAALKRLVRV